MTADSRLRAWARLRCVAGALLLGPLLGLLLGVSAAGAPRGGGPRDGVTLRLPDGRLLRGTRLRRKRRVVVLETAFGPLVVPRSRLEAPAEGEAPASTDEVPAEARETRSKWFVIESDLSTLRVLG
ncbi:MAG: hypothetical protein ACC662_00025 [Planctomycetota bacterium]